MEVRNMRRTKAAIVVVALCGTLSGCGPAADIAHEAQWADGEAWTVSAEPTRTVGVFDGADEYQFVDVSAAALQSDGDLVVADIGSRTVRLYDRSGAHLKTLGGPGPGPGEFRRPTQILVQAADSIFVWDDAAFRVTKFDPEGELVGVHGVGLEEIAKSVEPPLYPASASLLPGGELWVRLVEKSKGLPSAERFRQPSGALRVSADLTTVETAVRFGGVEQVMVEAPWGPFAVTPPLARNTSIAVQPNQARACIGEQQGPEVLCFGPDGSSTTMRWLAEPRAVRADEPEVDAWREASADLLAQKLSPANLRRMLDAVPVPQVWPEYSAIILDHGGDLWVKLGPTDDGRAIEYLVFDSTGVLLGSVSMPPVRVLEIGPDYVLGVFRDELDVEYVQLFEITKPSPVT